MIFLKRILLLTIIGGLFACTGLGPPTIPRDRFDYNTAISDSWKEQTLLNIVKLRYADMPLFVQVASVVSGYTLESGVSLLGTNSSEGAVQGNSGTLGGSATFTDRPTITYAPITGSQFNKSFMTPIPPAAVLFLIQSGWSVNLVFPLVVDSINGQRSELAAGVSQRSGDEEYYRVIELLRGIQLSGATGMQIQDEGELETALLIFHKRALSEEGQAAANEIARLLDIRPGLGSYSVKYGYLPADDTEIAMITRSMLQIIINLATQISVPPEHIAEGRTPPASEPVASGRRLIDVLSSVDAPEDAFVKVKYRDHWYYVDDRDFRSKVVFTFIMILFSLTESGDNTGLPLVTIPAG